MVKDDLKMQVLEANESHQGNLVKHHGSGIIMLKHNRI